MEVHTFNMRVPHDSKVRESFAPEFHLRQNSNNTTHLNDEGNDSGINDHITSARFNFPEDVEEQHNIGSDQINNCINNGQIPQQQGYQIHQQPKYLKRNIELQDYSSNGKQNINSNGNYNTQRTNQSNQTLSESNTVKKVQQLEDNTTYEEDEYEDHHYQHQHQNADQHIKYQQQSHYNQLMLHHHQLQQKQKQQYQQQNPQMVNIGQQKRLVAVHDLQNGQHEEEIIGHNQSHNSMNQIDKEMMEEDEDNIMQTNTINTKQVLMQQKQQQQRNYQNQMAQNQQQNFMNAQGVKLNANTNGMFAQKYGMHKQQLDEKQQQQLKQSQNKNFQQNGGSFYNYGDEENLEYQQQIGEIDEYNNQHLTHSLYLSKLKQQQQYQNNQQQQYPLKNQQYPPAAIQQIKSNNQVQQYSSKQPTKTVLQQLKQSSQEHLQQGQKEIGSKYNHRRNLSQLNYMQHDGQTFSDDEVLTLTQGEEEDDHHMQAQEDDQEVNQLLNKSRNQSNNINYNNHNSYSPQYPQTNKIIQQIDKQTIDEHSNNTSNNEEGIVNISSIKKKTVSNLNTPVHSQNYHPNLPAPLRENSSQQNTKNQIEASRQLSYQQNHQKIISTQNNTKQTRKNNFQEDKENQIPYNSSSLNKSQRENSNNLQKPISKQQGSVSPNTHAQLNQSLQNSCHQIYQKNGSQEDNNQSKNNQMLDVSVDENIQDTSAYSAFIPGNNYFDEEVYSQDTSIIKQKNQPQVAKNSINPNNKKYSLQYNKLDSNLYNEGGQRFTEEHLDCSQLNISELGDGYYTNLQDKKNDLYLEEYHQLQQNLHQNKKQSCNSQKAQQQITNSQNIQQQNQSLMTTTQNNGLQKQQLKSKSTNSTSATQSTSTTFQTQGFPRDSLGNKENIYNLCNITNEGQRINTLENKRKNKTSKDDKTNSDCDFDQIELEQAIENQEDIKDTQQAEDTKDQKINKSLADSKNCKMKTNCSRNSSQDSYNKNGLDRSRQMFENQHKEYKDIYDILMHEKTKNEMQENLIQSKSQMILNYQKVINQFKQQLDEKDQTILDQKKQIDELKQMQAENKESEINQEFIQNYEKLYEENKVISSQFKEIVEQNRKLLAEKVQLIKCNNDLTKDFQQLQDKQSRLDQSLQQHLEQLQEELLKKQDDNNLLLSQIDKITSIKDEEIDHLKKSLLNISTQDVSAFYRKKTSNSLESSQHQQNPNNKKLEKGPSFEYINASSVIDTSFTSSFQGQPPRKNQIPSSLQTQKNQQSTKSIGSNANGQNKNGISTNSNYNTICSHASQDETNISSQQNQNLRKARSSSLSCKGSDHQSLQNSMSIQNGTAQNQQTNHQYSGSFSHSNNNFQSQQMKTNNVTQQSNIPQLQQHGKVQAFSTTELIQLLSVSSENEILLKVKELIKFENCIISMIQKCAPTGYFGNEKPDLKQSWNILKKIMNKYLELKRNMQEQIDSELVNKIQQYLQINDKESIFDKIVNLQSENQKLTRIATLVKKNFNLEWAKSFCELEKALIEIENQQQSNPTSKTYSGLKIDHLPSQPSQLTFNGFSQQSSYQLINSKGQFSSNYQNLNSVSSASSPHMRNYVKKGVNPIQTQDYHLNQQQQHLIQQQQQQAHLLYGSAASSQRIDSANSNHIVHHNLLN